MKHVQDLVQRKTERTAAAEFRFAFALLSPGARSPHKDAARRSSTTVRRIAGEMNDVVKTVSRNYTAMMTSLRGWSNNFCLRFALTLKRRLLRHSSQRASNHWNNVKSPCQRWMHWINVTKLCWFHITWHPQLMLKQSWDFSRKSWKCNWINIVKWWGFITISKFGKNLLKWKRHTFNSRVSLFVLKQCQWQKISL